MNKYDGNIFSSSDLASFIVENCIPREYYDSGIAANPYIIGISGIYSAVGKSTIAKLIGEQIGRDKCLILDLDDWIIIDRYKRFSMGISGSNPIAWDMKGIVDSIYNLKNMENNIRWHKYNHELGIAMNEFRYINSKKIICLAGGFLMLPKIRSMCDYVVFIATFEDIVYNIYKNRNLEQRNYMEKYAKRIFHLSIKTNDRIIYPYYRHADLILLLRGGLQI